MKFLKDKCPMCGGDPDAILETLTCMAQISATETTETVAGAPPPFDDKQEFDYDGYTEVDWDSQTTIVDDGLTVTIRCGNCRHLWDTVPYPRLDDNGRPICD